VVEGAKLDVELNKEAGLGSKILEEVLEGNDETTAGDVDFNKLQLSILT
jgi:hypothetical protein